MSWTCLVRRSQSYWHYRRMSLSAVRNPTNEWSHSEGRWGLVQLHSCYPLVSATKKFFKTGNSSDSYLIKTPDLVRVMYFLSAQINNRFRQNHQITKLIDTEMFVSVWHKANIMKICSHAVMAFLYERVQTSQMRVLHVTVLEKENF